MTNQISDLTPAQIDAVLARCWETEQLANSRAHNLSKTPKLLVKYADEVREYQAQAAAARSEAEPYEREFSLRLGWSRYFLCTAANGHVHRGLHCSTCFATTSYRWLVELADCDEDAMVAEWGELACTVCFPSAPVRKGYGDGTSAYARRTAAERAARDAEKSAKQAERDAKAITAPDGSPLRVGYDTLRTKVAARNALSQAVQNYGWYGPSHPSDFLRQIAQLVEALEAVEIETAPVIDRAAKKALSEGADHDYRVLVAA